MERFGRCIPCLPAPPVAEAGGKPPVCLWEPPVCLWEATRLSLGAASARVAQWLGCFWGSRGELDGPHRGGGAGEGCRGELELSAPWPWQQPEPEHPRWRIPACLCLSVPLSFLGLHLKAGEAERALDPVNPQTGQGLRVDEFPGDEGGMLVRSCVRSSWLFNPIDLQRPRGSEAPAACARASEAGLGAQTLLRGGLSPQNEH